MKENLTKENFFNDQMKKYPDAMQEFCEGINEYKKENNWDKLFNAGVKNADISPGGSYTFVATKPTQAPKYHELPIALQIGIFIEHVQKIMQKQDKEWEVNFNLTYFDLAAEMDFFFSMRQQQIEESRHV